MQYFEYYTTRGREHILPTTPMFASHHSEVAEKVLEMDGVEENDLIMIRNEHKGGFSYRVWRGGLLRRHDAKWWKWDDDGSRFIQGNLFDVLDHLGGADVS